MTVVAINVVQCDKPACTRQLSISPDQLKGGFISSDPGDDIFTRQNKTILNHAQAKKWTRDNEDHDFCPDHSASD